MEIQRVGIDAFTQEALKDIEKLFSEGFEKEQIKRKFSWKQFVEFWEIALRLPWNALWFCYDDEEHVVGVIGGTCFPEVLTGQRVAMDVCWRTAQEVKGKGFGWELFAEFMDWAINEQQADRIMTHRFVSKDKAADNRYEKKLQQLGFKLSGYEYYLDVRG